MNRYTAIGTIALLVMVIAIPVYAFHEVDRMERAQVELQGQYIATGTLLYAENCVYCHGSQGEGLGAMPALNTPGLTQMDSEVLYRTIARSPHGSTMAAWHTDEGGVLNDFQVESLVALIHAAEWTEVERLAQTQEIELPQIPKEPTSAEVSFVKEGMILPSKDQKIANSFLGDVTQETQSNPHECSECHEEPEVHADRFGLDCGRCHGLAAWKPAMLVRHTFLLDHGGEGQLVCQTCHTESYHEHDCYACHDHQPDDMQEVHEQEGISDFEACISCHPTGREGEGQQIYQNRIKSDQVLNPFTDEANFPSGGHLGSNTANPLEEKGSIPVSDNSSEHVGTQSGH